MARASLGQGGKSCGPSVGEAGEGERCKGQDGAVHVAGVGNSSGVSRHVPLPAPELPTQGPAGAEPGQSQPALDPAAAPIFSLLIPITPTLVGQRMPCRQAKLEHSQHCPGMGLSQIWAPAQRGCSRTSFTTSLLSPVEGVGNELELDMEVAGHPWLGCSAQARLGEQAWGLLPWGHITQRRGQQEGITPNKETH